ncbi:MAG: hypothetical protein DCC88_10680 [Spirobacillus cienkowskii]|uniref:DUF4468 domain-containing protein n=1 Tax=Spirobacillus cienkowskii TaxID=495820 RepID=A0A369KP67_9BACT|nr:MAG: hypothetical protein DCC88_10680 [Spirobacillus cienkowskii]
MKFLIFLSLISIKLAVFANTIIVNEKNMSAAAAFDSFLSEIENFDLSPIMCSEIACTSKVLFNNIEVGDAFFTDEINNLNGASKVEIKILNNGDVSNFVMIHYVCITDKTCRFFLPEQYEMINYAYENNRFLSERLKRSPISTRYYYAFSVYLEKIREKYQQQNKKLKISNLFFGSRFH